MTALVRKAMLLAVGGILVASAAMAAVPSPGNSTLPGAAGPGASGHIDLVGWDGVAADPTPGTSAAAKSLITMTVRDLANNAIAGALVVFYFQPCKGSGGQEDVVIADVQPDPGVTAVCTDSTIRAVTDGAGQISIRIVGSAHNVGGGLSTGAGYLCGIVYADGVDLGRVTVGCYDQNGAAGTNPSDVSSVQSAALQSPGPGDFGRCDFDGNSSVNPTDTSQIQSVSLQGLSSQSGSPCY